MVENVKTDFSVGLVALTVLLTVYGQLIVKWRVLQAGPLPADLTGKAGFLAGLLFDPWVMSSMFAALLAALSWMAAMTKLELSYAYPFMSLAFVLVLILSAVIFHEAVTVPKVLGMVLVIAGLTVASQG
jgi:multidrug transporter EmrE-like cation transporter